MLTFYYRAKQKLTSKTLNFWQVLAIVFVVLIVCWLASAIFKVMLVATPVALIVYWLLKYNSKKPEGNDEPER